MLSALRVISWSVEGVVMDRVNQVFVQLNEADKYAKAKSPHFRRLSVIMLDNVIELQLSRKSERAFMFDGTSRYNGVRKLDRKRRKNISRDHGVLVAFAHEKNWITEEDTFLLRYTHRVRNRFYHQGEYDDLDAELSIRLLYRFIERCFPLWKTVTCLIQLSGYEAVAFENAADDKTGSSPLLLGCKGDEDEGLFGTKRLKSEEYWHECMARLLTYRPTDSLCELIRRKLIETLDAIDKGIDFLMENDPSPIFRDVLLRRFTVFTSKYVEDYPHTNSIALAVMLNTYLAIIAHEERLLDIADPLERATEFHRLLNAHTYIPDPLPRTTIEGYRKRAEALTDGNEAQGIALFLEIQEKLDLIGNCIYELTLDLDGEISEGVDRALGK